MQTTVAAARTSAEDIRETDIRLAPVPLHSSTTLLRQVRKITKPSLNNDKSAGQELEHYEEEDDVTSAPTVLERIE